VCVYPLVHSVISADRAYIDRPNFCPKGISTDAKFRWKIHENALLCVTCKGPAHLTVSPVFPRQPPPKLNHTSLHSTTLRHVSQGSGRYRVGKTNPHLFEVCAEASSGMRRQCIFRVECPSYGIKAVCLPRLDPACPVGRYRF